MNLHVPSDQGNNTDNPSRPQTPKEEDAMSISETSAGRLAEDTLCPAIHSVVANSMTIARGASDEVGGVMKERHPIPTFNGLTSFRCIITIDTSCIILVYNIDRFILFLLLPIPPHKQSSDAELAKGYEYLLGLKIWTLTFERAEDIRRQKGDKEAEVVALESTSPESIWLSVWLSDLDELDTVLVERNKSTEAKNALFSDSSG
eukprot:scaffold32953_cov67-Skeletonema_dohrnii-CCMP3373.AAC.1